MPSMTETIVEHFADKKLEVPEGKPVYAEYDVIAVDEDGFTREEETYCFFATYEEAMDHVESFYKTQDWLRFLVYNTELPEQWTYRNARVW